MATIQCLSDEIIAIILGYNDITIEDIINFRCVCKQFCFSANYDKHWEKKFFQRWPSAKKLYNKQSNNKKNERKESAESEEKNIESLNFIETGISCARQLRNYVSQIINKYHESTNEQCYSELIDNLIIFKDVSNLDKHLKINFYEINDKSKNFIKYSFFIDEIKNLLKQSPRRTACDLTERYYNQKILHYLKQQSIFRKKERFQRLPRRKQLLERIATIMSQWIQSEKDVLYSSVKASLDSMALEVLNCLREKHPEHSIFSTSNETFSYWKNNNINDNHWNEAENTQIMDTLQEHMLHKLNFRKSCWKHMNLECICIDNVLKNKYGHELIIYIIYHSVARRLGVRCNIKSVVYIYSFCMFWTPKYDTNNFENTRCFRLSFEEFSDRFVNRVSNYMTYSKYNRFAINATEMWFYIKILLENLIRHEPIIFKSFDLHEYKNVKSSTLSLRFKNEAMVIQRSENVKFAIGMIVTHRDKSTDNCTGVIIGWHRHIDKHIDFYMKDVWHWEVGLLPLNHRSNYQFEKQQTNYIILTDKNKMCYVEEDIITLTTPKWIDNNEIGRYFCKFEGTHYVPNKMLASFYPQDAAVTATITAISEN